MRVFFREIVGVCVFNTLLQWLDFFSYFRWLLLFIKVRSGPQTPMAVTGLNDYVRSNACAPRQQRRTFHYPVVLSGRYLLYHMDYACHQYRSAASQISLSTLWNSHRGIVKKYIGHGRREMVLKSSLIHGPFTPSFESYEVVWFWKIKQNRASRLLFWHGRQRMYSLQDCIAQNDWTYFNWIGLGWCNI